MGTITLFEDADIISGAEAQELIDCIAIVDRNLVGFVEAGDALCRIRDKRLFRSTHKTFEEFCRTQWGMGRNYANKMISAAEVVGHLGTTVPILPESERHARPLAALPPEAQRTVWQQAVESAPNGKVTAAHVQNTVTQFKREEQAQRHETQRAENAERVRNVARPDDLIGTFAAIMIDPPWDWGDEGDVNQFGRAKPRYATMPYEDILALPLAKLAAPNAHLYMWITNRSLPKGFALVEAWGFRYVTCITWVKPHFGLGNYYRGQTEHLLFGVRGSLPLARHDVGTVFHADRGPDGHSSKPDAAYEMIERCSPGPYLDMFSRRQRPEWVTWGENGIV